MEAVIDAGVVESNVMLQEHLKELENLPIGKLKKLFNRYKQALASNKYDNDTIYGVDKQYGPVFGFAINMTLSEECEFIKEVLGERNYARFFMEETKWWNVM